MSSENEKDYYEEEMEDGEDGGPSAFSASKGTSGVEEDDELMMEDQFSRLGDSSDDPEQKRYYMEYLSLIKEIDCQNQLIEEIKGQIMDLCAKPCKTRCEMKEIKSMRCCMEKENLKLQCLMNNAMKLQNFGSKRRYHEIPIATTLDEDNMTPYVGCIPCQISNWKGESSEKDKSGSNMDDDGGKDDNAIRCLCKAMGKMKICCPEDKKLVQEIAAALLCSKNKSKQSQDPCGGGSRKPKHKSRSHHGGDAGGPCSDTIEKLKQKICSMQSSVNRIKQEIGKREKGKRSEPCPCPEEQQESSCQDEESDPIIKCLSKRNTKSDQIGKLKENYLYLLNEFAKKDCQLKELEKRLKGFCGDCGGGAGGKGGDLRNADESELKLLRDRVGEMKEEQVEFKCIMREQSQQLEDYRNKYLVAQQKVEEQCVTLDKLNMNNKRIERQINTEVKEIRTKFQEKLNELLHFPKLLENEQIKLAQLCKEKDELQGKLVLVCKELKSLKSQLDSPQQQTDCRPQLAKCQMELQQTKTKLEEMERQRDLFCEQLKTTQDDLDTLRSESAKIIARTKERAEMLRCQQQEQIDRLEKELAQCRATACLSVSDREAVIREMQGQLNTLSFSFDAAQKQIKTLRNHIAYVSNENCFPVKC